MADFDIGFHVLADERAQDLGRFDDEMSLVTFFRALRAREQLPMDVTVTGLGDYLTAVDDPQAALSFLNGQLADAAMHLDRQRLVVQFVVPEIEHWNGNPTLDNDGERVRLDLIFGGLDQEGAEWYYSKPNVTS